MGIIAPFFTVPGLALTIIATAQAVMSRPISSALPGLLLGGLFQIFGFYITLVPFAGWVLGPIMTVFGGVLLFFYGFSIALQRIDIPIVKILENFLEAQQ